MYACSIIRMLTICQARPTPVIESHLDCDKEPSPTFGDGYRHREPAKHDGNHPNGEKNVSQSS